MGPPIKLHFFQAPQNEPKIIKPDETGRLNEFFYSMISSLFIMGVGLILFFNVEFTSKGAETAIGAVLICIGFLYALIEYQKQIEAKYAAAD